VECERLWLVRMSSGRLPSSVLSDEFDSLGKNMDCGSYGELHLALLFVAM